jgi:SAM-dependent methyltransferase
VSSWGLGRGRSWAERAYSMQLGDADAERLELLGRFYDPNSAAFIESAGVAAGDSIADLGCGHGAVTDRIAARVGDTGTVYAVDASADQLRIARSTLAHRRNATFIHGAVEDDPLGGVRVDWVYSRFLLMHVADVRLALLAMADMLTDCGALLLEIADVGSLRFLPGTPESDCGALGGMRSADHAVRPTTSPNASRNCSITPALPSSAATATSRWLHRRKPSSFMPWDSTSVRRRIGTN